MIYYTNIIKRDNNKFLYYLFSLKNIGKLMCGLVRLLVFLCNVPYVKTEKQIIINPDPTAAYIQTGFIKNYIHTFIVWNILVNIGPWFPYLYLHSLTKYIHCQLPIHIPTGVHMMLFFFPVKYLFILGILFTLDIFVPGGI